MNNNQGADKKQKLDAQGAGTVATEHPNGGAPGARKEVGDAASSQLHPPHVTENAEDAPAQDDIQSPTDTTVRPANAHGHDRISAEEAADQEIRPTSAYDGRSAEDKNWDPSQPG